MWPKSKPNSWTQSSVSERSTHYASILYAMAHLQLSHYAYSARNFWWLRYKDDVILKSKISSVFFFHYIFLFYYFGCWCWSLLSLSQPPPPLILCFPLSGVWHGHSTVTLLPMPSPQSLFLSIFYLFPLPERKPNPEARSAARRTPSLDWLPFLSLSTVQGSWWAPRGQKATPVDFLCPGTDYECFPSWGCPDGPRVRCPSPLEGRWSVVKGGVQSRCGRGPGVPGSQGPRRRSGRRGRKRGDVLARWLQTRPDSRWDAEPSPLVHFHLNIKILTHLGERKTFMGGIHYYSFGIVHSSF